MFIIPTPPTATMNSSSCHAECRAPGTATHLGFTNLHQHLDDTSHLFDEMLQGTQLASSQKTALHHPKAKVLFQFFDGWPMPESGDSNVE
jgi:hypothetical protein